jgi:hypothetical protein
VQILPNVFFNPFPDINAVVHFYQKII